MLIRRPDDIATSEITDERVYESRRRFLAQAGLAAATMAGATLLPARVWAAGLRVGRQADDLTPLKDVISYNNFYEFGTGKEDPA